MAQLKFTIIVPTRERLQTLAWTLQTLTQQNYENLEIIISDNYSQDGTEDYIRSLTDSRIKYINTGKRVSMSDNWEFAMGHATGDYITYIGDDDGMVAGAIEKCNEILGNLKQPALIWKKAAYIWGGHAADFVSNTLELPSKGEIYTVDAKEELKQILTFKKYRDCQIPAYFLPCLYNGFVKREVLDQAREKQGGHFFHSKYPDIYSSIVIPFFIDSYLYSTIPFGVNGSSGQSNGSGSILLTMQKKHKEAERFEKESTIPVHSKLKFNDYASIPFITMESYLQACDRLNIHADYFNVDDLAKEAISYTKRFTPQTMPWTLESIKATCDINNLPFNYNVNIENSMSLRSRLKNTILDILRIYKPFYVFYLRTYRKKNIAILKPPYEANILGASKLAGKKLGFTN